MAYEVPTTEQFIERFPEFDGQDDAATFALSDAAGQVDQTWREADYQLAIMLLAAHYLTASTAQAAGDSAPGSIRSESFGPISVSYGNEGGSSDSSGFSGTEYGRRYLTLAKQNFPAIMVV